jgi:acetate CoA/acetoacetate CoA-transferase beta subunit
MDPKEIKSYIATRVAKELKDGDVVNLGAGLPRLIPSCLPKGVHVVFQSEVLDGHVDCTILGALEVDQDGNLSDQIIPGKNQLSTGSATDLVTGAKKVVVAMEHSVKGNPKILTKCRLPFTEVGCVDMIVTEMGVFEVTEGGLLLTEYNPEYTVDDIHAVTEADFTVTNDLKPIDISTRKKSFFEYCDRLFQCT